MSVFQLLKTVNFFSNPLPWNGPKKLLKKELVRLKMVDFHFRLSDLTSDQSVFLLRTRIGTLRCKSVWPIWHWFYYHSGANDFAPKCTRLLYHCHIRTTNLVTYWYQNNIWNIYRLRYFYGNFDIFWKFLCNPTFHFWNSKMFAKICYVIPRNFCYGHTQVGDRLQVLWNLSQ